MTIDLHFIAGAGLEAPACPSVPQLCPGRVGHTAAAMAWEELVVLWR